MFFQIQNKFCLRLNIKMLFQNQNTCVFLANTYKHSNRRGTLFENVTLLFPKNTSGLMAMAFWGSSINR